MVEMKDKVARQSLGDYPNDHYEQHFVRSGFTPVAGVDEAGRGPWAGPVVAAAVILDPQQVPQGLQDSKKLNAARREALFLEISACASVGIGIADVERIDEMNILQATLWAMQSAVEKLPQLPGGILVDGNQAPKLARPTQCVVKGDALCLSIAAASIIAKVTRDRIMRDLANEFPDYGWDSNKGYGTKAHGEALRRYGVTPHHRRSFRPVRAALGVQ